MAWHAQVIHIQQKRTDRSLDITVNTHAISTSVFPLTEMCSCDVVTHAMNDYILLGFIILEMNHNFSHLWMSWIENIVVTSLAALTPMPWEPFRQNVLFGVDVFVACFKKTRTPAWMKHGGRRWPVLPQYITRRFEHATPSKCPCQSQQKPHLGLWLKQEDRSVMDTPLVYFYNYVFM